MSDCQILGNERDKMRHKLLYITKYDYIKLKSDL